MSMIRSVPTLTGLALVAVLSCGSASAQRMTKVDGNKLLTLCTAAKAEQCDIYLSGVADAIGAGGHERAEACIPIAVTGNQLRDVVVKYLKEHPQDRALKAGLLTLRAFAGAFACKP